MLTEFFQYLKNWFYGNEPRFDDEFIIENGQLNISEDIKLGQYYRIFGSTLNDGVYLHDGKEALLSETFTGTVRLMAVPREVSSLISEISAWQEKYGAVDSQAMSPFSSESFGGYSYSKGANGSENGASGSSWQGVFRCRLNHWRKI
jgi:hypothetical protein